MSPTMNSVYLQDCIEGMKSLADGAIDLVFADPPFNIGYDYDEYDDKRACEDYLDWSKQWMAEIARVLKDDGTFWLAIGDEYAAELKVIATRELGLSMRSWVIWYYTFGVNCKNNFSRSHTHLFYFTKDKEQFTFNADDPDIRVPSARMLVYGDKRANPKGRLPDNTWCISGDMAEGYVLRPQDAPASFRGNGDVWYYSRVCGTFRERAGWHGCQMPEQLLGRIIRACSREGETVLDPFGGSGTTLAVAKKLKRQFLGFELSTEYFANISERLESIAPGDPLDGPADPVGSAPKTSQGRHLKDVGKKKAVKKKTATPKTTKKKTAKATKKKAKKKSRAVRVDAKHDSPGPLFDKAPGRKKAGKK